MCSQTDWTDTKHNTLKGQYCVYNIIGLQNISLKVPVVTNSSILDVGKASQIRICFTYTLNKKHNNFQWK